MRPEPTREPTWMESMYAEENERLRAQRDAYLFMWGSLSAEATRSPRVRSAMLTAIRLAEESGDLDGEAGEAMRDSINRWADKLRIRGL